MIQDADPIASARRLWRVTIVDSLDNPTSRQVMLIRGGETAFQVGMEAKKKITWKQFQAKFPKAEIAAIEISGILEV